MKFLAIERSGPADEIVFEFESRNQRAAETYADLVVFGTMHECHHQTWRKFGIVISESDYHKEMQR